VPLLVRDKQVSSDPELCVPGLRDVQSPLSGEDVGIVDCESLPGFEAGAQEHLLPVPRTKQILADAYVSPEELLAEEGAFAGSWDANEDGGFHIELNLSPVRQK
jgi:hypothetical protein